MNNIDLDKTLIIHTIVENSKFDFWFKLYNLNRRILNQNGYNNIYLMSKKPEITKDKRYHPLNRQEIWLNFDKKLLDEYEYFVFMELDSFFLKTRNEFQKILEGKSFHVVAYDDWKSIDYYRSFWMMFTIFSSSYLRRLLPVIENEMNFINEIGMERYKKDYIECIKTRRPTKASPDETFFYKILKENKQLRCVNSLNLITPNNYKKWQTYVNGKIERTRLSYIDFDQHDYPIHKKIDQVIWLHCISIEKNWNELIYFLKKEKGFEI